MRLWEGPATQQPWHLPAPAQHSLPCRVPGDQVRGSSAHLFQWQLPEQRQRAGEQPDEEGRGRAHYVDHGGRQHGDVGVLPAEGVDECYHRVAAFGQSAAGGQTGRKGWLSVGEGSSTSTAEARDENQDLSQRSMG